MTFVVVWVALAFIPVIPIVKVDVVIGRLALGLVYFAGLAGEDVLSGWPWMLGHLAAAIVLALLATVIRNRRRTG